MVVVLAIFGRWLESSVVVSRVVQRLAEGVQTMKPVDCLDLSQVLTFLQRLSISADCQLLLRYPGMSLFFELEFFATRKRDEEGPICMLKISHCEIYAEQNTHSPLQVLPRPHPQPEKAYRAKYTRLRSS